MLASITEEVLLHHAVRTGLLRAAEIAAASQAAPAPDSVVKWGRILDRLIVSGRLTESAVRRLVEEISSTEQGAVVMARTLDGDSDGGAGSSGSPAHSQPEAAARQAPTSELARTLPSEAGAAGAAASATVSVGSGFPAPHWDKYEFVEVLGRGGMGAVYQATDRRLGRPVALKFIHGDDRGLIRRFLQEARSQARLDHPHICKVYEVGTVDGKPYIAMELVIGQTLDRACALLTMTEKLQILKDAAEAVHAAHAQGVIHRDLKPSNVTTERNGMSNDPQRFEVLANQGQRPGNRE